MPPEVAERDGNGKAAMQGRHLPNYWQQLPIRSQLGQCAHQLVDLHAHTHRRRRQPQPLGAAQHSRSIRYCQQFDIQP